MTTLMLIGVQSLGHLSVRVGLHYIVFLGFQSERGYGSHAGWRAVTMIHHGTRASVHVQVVISRRGGPTHIVRVHWRTPRGDGLLYGHRDGVLGPRVAHVPHGAALCQHVSLVSTELGASVLEPYL